MKDMRDAYFDEICDLAMKDKDVIVLADDMDVFSLRKLKEQRPDQFFNMGVAEQNMINVASGLAASGKKVVIYGISSFVVFRCYEQIKCNICSMGLPVVIVGVGNGFSFSYDGPTHHGIQDFNVMRSLDNMHIFNPCDALSAQSAANFSCRFEHPTYVRIDKRAYPSVYSKEEPYCVIAEGSSLIILSTGYMTHRAIEILDKLKKYNVFPTLIDVSRLQPLPDLNDIIDRHDYVITIEENSLINGFGTAVLESISEMDKKVKRLGLDNKEYLIYGTRQWMHEKCSIDVKSLTNSIIKYIGATRCT